MHYFLSSLLGVIEVCTSRVHVQNGQEADAKALVGMLAPTGHVLRAIHTADIDALIKFEFPLTRLPTYTQQLIRLEPGRYEFTHNRLSYSLHLHRMLAHDPISQQFCIISIAGNSQLRASMQRLEVLCS